MEILLEFFFILNILSPQKILPIIKPYKPPISLSFSKHSIDFATPILNNLM